jgi:DMSO/TMAO reductase YedYZ molybdopterin-dependent catalytic subunit
MRHFAFSGFWAAIAAVVAQRLLHLAMPDAPFAPYSIAARIVRESPGPLVTWGIEQMGHKALPLLGWSCVAVTLVLGLALGRRSPLIFGALGFLLTVLAARIDPINPPTGPTLLSAFVAGAAATLTALLLLPSEELPQFDATRRRLVAGAALGMLFWITGAGAIAKRQSDKAPSGANAAVRADSPAVIPADSSFHDVPRLSPRITPTKDHYLVDIDLDDPHVSANDWQLTIKGKVANELSFSLNQLRAMQTKEILLCMQCISNDVGGGLAGNSRWTGVSTAELLAMAAPAADAKSVVARSVDGFSDVVDLSALQHSEGMVAFGINGMLLPRSHGYPARLLYPGHYGMRSVKWVNELEVIDHDADGYWAQRGWDKEALMRTGSRIDAPKDGDDVGPSFTVAGVAWAGDRRISKVEVSTDSGETWTGAQLEQELSPLAWRRWRIDLKLPSGAYELLARAYDGTGTVQDAKERAPHPSGASGYHTISINVG